MTASGLLLRPEPGVPTNPYATPADRDAGSMREWAETSASFLDAVPLYVKLAALVVLAGLIVRTFLRSRRAKQNNLGDLTDADRRITKVTALIATAVLAEGMWGFFVDVIDVPAPVRVVLFAFIELALLAAARRARRHLYRVGSLGTAPFTVFGLASVSATLAAVHAASTEERLFRLLAAAVAAHMWIDELREERDILHHNNPGKYPPVHKLIDWKRIAAHYGLIEAKSHNASQIAVIRRIDRLGRLLDRFHAARVALATTEKPSALRVWWLRRLDRRIVRQTQAACTHINLAEDPKVRLMLLRRLAVVRGVVAATDPKAADTALDTWIAGQIGGRPVTVAEPIVVEPVRREVSARPDMPADPQVDIPLDGWEDTQPDLGQHLSVDVPTGHVTGADTQTAGRPVDTTRQDTPDTRPVPDMDTRVDIRPDTRPVAGRVAQPATPSRPVQTADRPSDRTSDRAPQWTAKQLRAFELRDREHMTYEQIARRLGIATKTVSRWFKKREERAEQTDVQPDVSTPAFPVPVADVPPLVSVPRPPVTSGVNGHAVSTANPSGVDVE